MRPYLVTDLRGACITVVGINTDPARYADDLPGHAEALKAAGFTMARFPLRLAERDIAIRFNHALATVGLKTLPILARESFGPFAPRNTYVKEIRSWVREIYCDHWQIGNEPDLPAGGSSWTMPAGHFGAMLAVARTEIGSDRYLIAGGLASGQPEYLDGVDLTPVDAISVHCYGQRPAFSFPEPSWGFGVAETLIAHYHRFGKPIWVTEFGGREGEFDDGQARAEYYVEMIGAARRAHCAGVLPFCWHDYDGFGIAGTAVGEAVSAAISRPELAVLASPPPGGTMTLEEVAAKHGGFYSPPVITSGTKRNPTSRLAFVNDTPNGYILEINGEAADAVYVPNA